MWSLPSCHDISVFQRTKLILPCVFRKLQNTDWWMLWYGCCFNFCFQSDTFSISLKNGLFSIYSSMKTRSICWGRLCDDQKPQKVETHISMALDGHETLPVKSIQKINTSFRKYLVKDTSLSTSYLGRGLTTSPKELRIRLRAAC